MFVAEALAAAVPMSPGSPPARVLFEAVTFSLAPGQVLRIAGRSGAGKTSLLRILAWLDNPLSGTVALDGHTPDALGVPQYRRRVVYAAQRPVMWPGSVADNLHRARSFASGGHEGDPAATDALGVAAATLASLGLGKGILEASAARLSEGERQRVALVRALAVGPQVLLLDEPTSALDPAHRDRVEALLLQRAEGEGLAVVLVTHETAQAERLGARVLQLRPADAPEPRKSWLGGRPGQGGGSSRGALG
ncbi:MAG: ATP-binding cassette domain-containing protein [Myxococcota bacterium]